jgi:hypothetical protein
MILYALFSVGFNMAAEGCEGQPKHVAVLYKKKSVL